MTNEFDLIKANLMISYSILAILDIMNNERVLPNKTITEICEESSFKNILEKLKEKN